MADTIPSDSHSIGDSGHVTDHNNIADVVGLIASVLAQMGTGMGQGNGWLDDPAGNASNIATIQAMQGIPYMPQVFYNSADHALTGSASNVNIGTISTTADMLPLVVGNSYVFDIEVWYEPGSGGATTTMPIVISWGNGVGAASSFAIWGDTTVTGGVVGTGGTSFTKLITHDQQTTNLPFTHTGPPMVSGASNHAHIRGVIFDVTTADVMILKISHTAAVTIHPAFIRITPTWQE